MKRVLILPLAIVILTASPTFAASITFTGSSGTLSASATFETIAGNLQVVLANTSTADTNSNGDVLQALFFNIATNPSLGYADADLSSGSVFLHTATLVGSGSDVGAEWAYASSAGGLGSGVTQSYGLSSAGYGLFGPGDTLCCTPLHPDRGGSTTPPNGGDFGLVSAGWLAADDANGFVTQGPHIDNSVTFLLTGFDPLLLSGISGVRFQYGTSLSETNIPGVTGSNSPLSAIPEPASLLLLGSGMGIAARRLRRRHA